MNKDEAIKVAAGYFPNYPSVKEFSVTTDGQVFENNHYANEHAKTLGKEKDAVFVVNKDECIEPKTDNTSGKDEAENTLGKDVAENTEKPSDNKEDIATEKTTAEKKGDKK